MSNHHILRRGIGLLSAGLFLMGCSSGKRLGESSVEHRRYRAGWHVNIPEQGSRLMERHPEVTASMVDGVIPMDFDAAALVLDWEGSHTPMHRPREGTREWTLPRQSSASISSDAPGTTWASRLSQDAHLLGRVGEAGKSGTASPEEQDLPEAIYGRHPGAVPGFILSLGWLFGFIGALALESLGMFNSAFPLALGFIASAAGYFISRKSYRMSKSHPEQYPRGGLSRVARWLSLAFLAPIALYIVLIILVILIGGW